MYCDKLWELKIWETASQKLNYLITSQTGAVILCKMSVFNRLARSTNNFNEFKNSSWSHLKFIIFSNTVFVPSDEIIQIWPRPIWQKRFQLSTCWQPEKWMCANSFLCMPGSVNLMCKDYLGIYILKHPTNFSRHQNSTETHPMTLCSLSCPLVSMKKSCPVK